MTLQERKKLIELLKTFKNNAEFRELINFLPLYKQDKDIEYATAGRQKLELNVFELLVYELNELDKLENQFN